MSSAVKKAEFLSFAIENYKINNKSNSGEMIAKLFNTFGVDNFLIQNYDILHTLGKKQILEEIEVYLKKRGA